jgi:hypothetical protein
MATQKPSAESVIKFLTRHLDYKPRKTVERRYQAMVRELIFLGERQDQHLAYIRYRKWSDDRLKVLFGLNSIYQEIIGPLTASTRVAQVGIGSQYPLTHGTMRFDGGHSHNVREADNAFFSMVSELGFLRSWMAKNTCGELVFHIARHEREDVTGDQV